MHTEKRTEGGRIFQSPVLEALTKTHIAIPLTLFYTAGFAILLYSVLALGTPWISAVLVFVGGFFSFTLVEYAMHRWFYHMPTDTPRRKRMQYVFHGIHHEFPRDKRRLAMPPLMAIVLTALFVGLFRLVLGQSGYAFSGGFLWGYCTYLLVHYAIHVYKPPRNILRELWKHHNLHHYVGDKGAFGVSSPFWDMVFGTMPEDPRTRKVGGRSAAAN
jgi:sterol desaturase/sphingolipid hydroxylase (fatty acid hydroxylase superfamily)